MMRIGKLGWVLVACVWPALALADEPWSHEITPQVIVNGHSFRRAKVTGNGCSARFQLFFNAPENQYSDKKNLVRNFHRFIARVRIGDHKVESGSFVNRAAGERVYTFDFDSTAQGCWTKTLTKVWKLDVNGCRDQRCIPEPL